MQDLNLIISIVGLTFSAVGLILSFYIFRHTKKTEEEVENVTKNISFNVNALKYANSLTGKNKALGKEIEDYSTESNVRRIKDCLDEMFDELENIEKKIPKRYDKLIKRSHLVSEKIVALIEQFELLLSPNLKILRTGQVIHKEEIQLPSKEELNSIRQDITMLINMIKRIVKQIKDESMFI